MEQKKKSKIRKILGITVISIVILLAVITVSAVFFLDHIVKATMESVGPQVLGAPVKVTRVSFNLASAAVEIGDLFIGNPKGYKHNRSLTVKKIRVDLLRSSLLKKKLVVEEFTLDGVDVYFEPSSNLLSNNLSQLNSNVQSFTEKLTGPQGKKQKSSPKKEAEQKKLQVDRLCLKNIYVNVVASAPGLPTSAAPIPVVPIVLDGLGKNDDGVTALDVTAVILNKLTLGVFTSIGDAMPSLKSITNAGAKLLSTTSGALASLGELITGGGTAKQKAPAKQNTPSTQKK